MIERTKIDIKDYAKKSKIVGLVLSFSLRILFFGLVLWLLLYFLIINSKKLSFVKLITSSLVNLDVKPATLAGVTPSGLRYYLTSQKLNNYISNFLSGEQIQVTGPVLVLELPDGSKATLEGKTGTLNNDTNEFTVKDEVRLTSSKGFSLNGSEVTINLKTNVVYSNTFIYMEYDKMSIFAEGFSINNNFSELRLNKKVELLAE